MREKEISIIHRGETKTSQNKWIFLFARVTRAIIQAKVYQSIHHSIHYQFCGLRFWFHFVEFVLISLPFDMPFQNVTHTLSSHIYTCAFAIADCTGVELNGKVALKSNKSQIAKQRIIDFTRCVCMCMYDFGNNNFSYLSYFVCARAFLLMQQ